MSNSFVVQSFLIHSAALAVLASVIWLAPKGKPSITQYKVEIQEVKMAAPVEEITPEINLTRPKVETKPSEPPRKKVFGITKDTLTSQFENAVGVKLGTTLAKERDNEIIDEKDAVALPVPTAEYLVSEMPRLKSEVRIPYPEQAKKKNIEGVVLMELLIDENGTVRQASLIEGPGFGLNEAAMGVIRGFVFFPAKVEGKSVAVKIRYGYRFVLN
ncbi:MAG: energy transducer TonB [Pseudobdellovibrionaceae bacterium]